MNLEQLFRRERDELKAENERLREQVAGHAAEKSMYKAANAAAHERVAELERERDYLRTDRDSWQRISEVNKSDCLRKDAQLASAQTRIAELSADIIGWEECARNRYGEVQAWQAAAREHLPCWDGTKYSEPAEWIERIAKGKTQPVTAEMLERSFREWQLDRAPNCSWSAYIARKISAPPECPGCGQPAVQVVGFAWECGNRECAVMGVDS
jgi:hypothetical protein